MITWTFSSSRACNGGVCYLCSHPICVGQMIKIGFLNKSDTDTVSAHVECCYKDEGKV